MIVTINNQQKYHNYIHSPELFLFQPSGRETHLGGKPPNLASCPLQLKWPLKCRVWFCERALGAAGLELLLLKRSRRCTGKPLRRRGRERTRDVWEECVKESDRWRNGILKNSSKTHTWVARGCFLKLGNVLFVIDPFFVFLLSEA